MNTEVFVKRRHRMSVINGRMPINSPIRELQEQDAVKYFKDYIDFCEKDGIEIPVREPYDLAIAALEEIQQYRALGTVRQIEDFIADWRKYRELGNLEELQRAREKQMAKKPTSIDCYNWECPTCGAYHSTDGDYCSDCGQAIDWSGKE